MSTQTPLSTTLSSTLGSFTRLVSSGLTTSDAMMQSRSAAPIGDGLKAEYFRGIDLRDRRVERIDPTVNFNWGNGGPATAVGTDFYSARWSGYVLPQHSETYTFFTNTDDGVRLWVNGQQIINDWTSRRLKENQGTITLEAGKFYEIKMEYFENWASASSQLSWASRSQAKQIIPQSQLFTAIPITFGGGNGLMGEYFTNGQTLSDRVFTRTDATVNFAWGTNAPDASLRADGFGARWTGQIQPLYSETYTFATNSDDGARLWVNGQQIINDWTSRSLKENRGTITLEAGKKYDIRLEYYDNWGIAQSELYWSSARQTREIIPQSQLFSSLDLNDKPTLTLPTTAPETTRNTPLSLTGLSVADPDAGTSDLTVTLNATNGTLTVNGNVSGGARVISGNNTSTVILMGTLLQLNATLASLTGVQYQPRTGFEGTDSIRMTVNDNGNTGIGRPLTDTQTLAVKVGGGITPPPIGQSNPLGINLSEVEYWTTEWPFVDAFKVNSGWISQRQGASWGQGGALSLTPDGWVAALEAGQYAETIMFRNNGRYPTGRYVVLYDGEGRIEFGFGSGTVQSRTPGRMEVDVVTRNEGIALQIRETNPNNPIRNIRVIMPGFESTYQTQPFHPLFLERLRPFKLLRFMDWQKTNASPLKNWSDRTLTNSMTQANKNGVALEHMIDLANALKKDAWFTVPHEATDDYVRQMATLIRDRLDPSLKVHFEYSNEVWNYAFQQTLYAQRKGLELGLSTDQYQATLLYYSQRSLEVFKIFEEVFGGRDRLVRVLASQADNPYGSELMLRWKDAYRQADQFSIAPYFDGPKSSSLNLNNPANVNQTLAKSVDQIVDDLLKGIREDFARNTATNKQLATKYGLPLTAYEGGMGLTSYQFGAQEPQVTQLFTAVNRSARMRDVYNEYLNTWKSNGGGLFNQFYSTGPYSRWGYWGFAEYQDQPIPQMPKYQGILDFAAANP